MSVNEKMTAIADSIRAKTGGTEKLNLDQMASAVGEVYEAGYAKGQAEGGDTTAAYDEGFEAGKKAEYDVLWDGYQQNGTRIHYPYAFAYSWNDAIYKPKYDITNAQNVGLQYLFAYSTVTDTIVTIDASKATTSQHLFDSNRRLRTIRKLIVSENNSFNTWFRYCEDLENLTIEGTIAQNGLNLQWSTKLSKASITSIINCLSTTTSGLTVTLSKTAKEAAFTADEWAALIATRTNWTISLV